MKTKYRLHDLVTLKGGGPPVMQVSGFSYETEANGNLKMKEGKPVFEGIECMWIDDEGRYHAKLFHSNSLEPHVRSWFYHLNLAAELVKDEDVKEKINQIITENNYE